MTDTQQTPSQLAGVEPPTARPLRPPRPSLPIRRRAVGLDIAGDTVRVAEVEKSAGGYRVIRCGCAQIVRKERADESDGDAARLEVSTGAAGADITAAADIAAAADVPACANVTVEADVEALADAIKSAMASARIRKRDVVANIPREPVACSIEVMPAMTPCEREAVIRRRGLQQCGCNIAWDYILLSGKNDAQHRILSAYAPAQAVEQCLDALEACGLRASSIAVSHLALLQAFRRHTPPSGEPAALVHFSGHTAAVVIIDGGTPVLVRQIRCDERRAASYVTEEISRTLIYFKQQNKGRQARKIFYCDAPAGVVELLAQDSHISAADVSGQVFARATGGSEYTTAAALAVSAIDGNEIDLLPDQMKEARSFRARSAALVFVAALTVLSYAISVAALATAGNIYAEARDRLDGQLQEFEPIRQMHSDIELKTQKLSQKQELHDRLASENLPWPYLLWRLGTLLPGGAGVTEMVFERGTGDASAGYVLKITGNLTGAGSSRTAMLQALRDNLQASGLFSAVHLEPVSEAAGGGPMRFMMRCELAGPEAWRKEFQ